MNRVSFRHDIAILPGGLLLRVVDVLAEQQHEAIPEGGDRVVLPDLQQQRPPKKLQRLSWVAWCVRIAML